MIILDSFYEWQFFMRRQSGVKIFYITIMQTIIMFTAGLGASGFPSLSVLKDRSHCVTIVQESWKYFRLLQLTYQRLSVLSHLFMTLLQSTSVSMSHRGGFPADRWSAQAAGGNPSIPSGAAEPRGDLRR